MNLRLGIVLVVVLGSVAAGGRAGGQDRSAVALPQGVKAVWDLDKAQREATSTCERIAINGLWRWQPAKPADTVVPRGNWGYFKVPGCWPGITDYMQKDCQTVFVHPSWKDEKLSALTAAWYEREITVPDGWQGRRIALAIECLNSFATAYVDGKPAGELRFPGGELDVTTHCRPGGTHTLSLLVAAMPLRAVVLSYNDTAAAREVKGTVARRGLCGDVSLVSTPPAARIADVRIETSVRKWQIACSVALQDLAADARYLLRADVTDHGRTVKSLASREFTAADLVDGRIGLAAAWHPDRLWDLPAPQNVYELRLSLHAAGGKLLDAAVPERFGFREFWIDGRDFYLNGSRIYLSCVPLDNAQISAGLAGYAAAKESLLRLKSFGINFVYTHNYGCEPGSHLALAEVLRAADDVGMLVSFSQPHFSHYDWRADDADRTNGYARHAAYYVRVAGNHPAVVCYSMSHNATGYSEDMNPDLIDGIHDARDAWANKNVVLARRAAAIVTRLDPGRFVYHHASGNLGPLHASNFYPNFAPVQELCDWFEHWATEGVKPVFTCEYGAPFTWDWSTYRGWYQGKRSFGSAAVPWEFCFAEWNAQFLGDRAFRIGEPEKANLRWENRQFRAGRVWHRWDYPYEIGSTAFTDRYQVFAKYTTDNWRAFRTWGVSATSPWEHGHFWRLRDGVDKGRRVLPVDWEHLQRPGFSADYIDGRYERMDLAFDRDAWVATPAAEALMRNNQPCLAYLAGRESHFTGKDHNFLPGETVEKQVVLLNNSRVTTEVRYLWTLGLPQPLTGSGRTELPTGQQQRMALRLPLPADLPPGAYELRLSAQFGHESPQLDTLTIHVLPPRPAVRSQAKIALFDPRGETRQALERAGIACQPVAADADLAPFDVLLIGKAALTPDGPAPNLARVRDGLKVVVFEQTSAALEQRLGFRVVEYGLRQVFARIKDHPLLAGLAAENLCDWRGSATLLPPRLKYEMRPQHGPTVLWCDIPVTRTWRVGNYGNVASVLIEKPARGDFRPIVDGGFSLQYSPLLEYRDGRGLVLFCQLDVTGRSDADPAAERLIGNIVSYVSAWKPSPLRTTLYAGDPAGKTHLERAGIAAERYSGGRLTAGAVLVVGPGGGRQLAGQTAAIAEWLKADGRLLTIGLDEKDLHAILPGVTVKPAEHIAAYFEPFGMNSPLAGIGPADVHNRGPKTVPLITAGAVVVGDGVLAASEAGNIVCCQLAPWEFDYRAQYNLKRTFRRVSFAVSRALANLGAAESTPLLERFGRPVSAGPSERRWREGLYLDQPEEWDDPYRFFRW